MAFFLVIQNAVFAQVTVTYKVDISNYLAGGATLGPNGIRIGGNFGDLNSPLPNWQPSAIPCGMTNSGNNVWSISVTYPASSVGQTQFYKFVNNDWGNNEGGPTSTIASGGCGLNDGNGNINRRLVIPATNTTVCFVWDACTSCQTSSGISATTVSPATAITANSATVGGSASGSGIIARGICYATSQNPTTANSASSAGNGSGDFSSNLTGLSPATTYYARAFASDVNGTVYGNQVSFTTLPSLNITATTGNSSNVTSSAADVSGSVSGTNISSRGICYGTATNPTIAGSVANAGSGAGAFTANLTNLTANTTYYARAFGSGPAGTAYGSQISFTTLPAQAQGISITYKVDITNFLTAGNSLAAGGIRIAGNFADRGAKVNGTSMVNWTPTHPASAMNDEGNNLWSITVTYPSASAAQTQTYKFVNGDWGSNEGLTGSAIATGGCGTDDGAGNINRTFIIPSAAQTLTFCWDQCTACTTTSAPVVTTAAAATAITANSASLAGTATGTGITARGVCFATTQNPSTANSVANAGTGEGNFTANLSGLSPNTLYYARAFATNSAGTTYGSQISFTTQPGTPVQTVNVTYRVDVSNYIAAGNTIAANGIRIAGNFADRGAKVNGSAMVNWTPTDAASAMTNSGNNIWTITVTYPDSSFAKTQQYKFVNGNWGQNEGGPTSAILTGQCGVNDGGGNINRTLLIPSTAQTLTYCWDQCNAVCTTPIPQAFTYNITAITSNSAAIFGASDGINITARGICYSTSPNPTATDLIVSGGSGNGPYSGVLQNLSPNTVYYARAFATNQSGTSYGQQTSFRTMAFEITFKVDISNYLAAGNSVGVNGIRIAGEFPPLGATNNGTQMPMYDPSNAASAMSNSGSNIWTIAVSFPDSAIGKTLEYEFVNSFFGTNNNEGGFGTGIVTGGCGIQYPNNDVNRVLIIPSSAQTLTYCWDQCTACNSAPVVTTAATATAITANSASLAGTASGTSITARGVCFATTQNPSTANSVANAGTGEGNFTANLSGLSPNTLYYARAFATNSAGTTYGSQISFTTQPGTPVQTVNVTYRVDVSNYIAAGNTIAANGIRIAGNFADRGAKVNGTAMVNWTPTDAASAMTNSGNNIWTITVTYPDSSFAKTQQYKFVNGNWGQNEGGPTSSILTGQCGIDDGAGNINRTLLIPSTAQTLTYCWDQCGTCVPEVSINYVSAITSNSALAMAFATGNSISSRGFCISTSPNPTISNSVIQGGSGSGTFNLPINSLNPNTVYFIRAFATNQNGTGYSDQISFKTKAFEITFRVDISNYLLAGNIVQANGIRIGGNFGELGATNNGTAIPNNDPTNAASAMTALGGNIWEVKISFPDSSIGKTLTYIFTNSTYQFSESNIAIVTGGCGAQFGNVIARTLTIPSTAQTLTYCWGKCALCASEQFVNVTYRVDVSNYIAAGNTIAANGIRIAGNFADRGAKVNGTAMVNWTPTDAASAMTNSGNNIWTITVTYPDSSFAKTQQYKFVNGNWGQNEGGSGSSILTGQCGIDDGAGNINRTLLIPSTAQTLTYCWDQCTACSTATALTVTTAATATAITASSASVSGTASGTGITARGICFATTQNPTIANSVANSGSGEGTFTANLSGLNPSTLYYARAFAINANDTAYGAQISFTTQPGTPVQTVNVTYRVDVSNYIAAGNTIAANGIRIAGNFADRGAKVNGSAMVNWTPTDAASAMTNSGNNIWTITVTYPDSSFAKTQQYKFVNGNWGQNEGGPTSSILTGQCGIDDGAGNINRTLLIPSTAQTHTYCWDQCGTCNSAPASCGTPNVHNSNLSYGSMVDQDNNSYKTIVIGTQNWMAENLKTGHYRNGEKIPVVTENTSWNGLTTGATCWYNNDSSSNDCPYGRLYNWYTVDDPRGLCPAGWHVPTNHDWNILVKFLDPSGDTSNCCANYAGLTMKSAGTITDGTGLWLSPNSGTNTSGFSGLAAGYRYDGQFGYINNTGGWWTSNAESSNLAWYRFLYNDFDWLTKYAEGYPKKHGYSVRCLNDNLITGKDRHSPDEKTVFPNPFKEFLNIQSSSNGTFRIVSIQGKTLAKGILEPGLNKIETGFLPVGVYILHSGEAGPVRIVKE